MTSESGATATPTPRPARPRALPTWVIVALSVFFGLFYAYAVWNAVAFLISQATGPLGLNGAGWAILLAAVLFPLVAFGVAFAIGWRRTWGELSLTLLAGLCIVAVFWLNVVAYSVTNGAALLG
ncbi:bacitracin resistance protein [Microbacterium flavum]|uniref:Bacitracin resistance protein n=1 Tax=Microbacterium flavum TaxID=415216 RepID=A0ABS5XSM9_9MICO|nr:bacitracin resistance protein [Microbacterium flavum]MBT8797431.1 bacitracin resistance protein [Microbacterium flavum]